ncbi:Sodium/hydrogen exchanger family-domain-containing protein [Pilaira anomala]|nr:Sodium/hydrogen exchanger family-domain-containing protein [Pilaira anomala]
MRLLLILPLLCLFISLLNPIVLAEPSSIRNLLPNNAEYMAAMFRKGEDHRTQLQIKKELLYQSIKAMHRESSDELYALAGVRLEDFEAFQSFVIGILQVYDQTVNEPSTSSAYDFRSPALKLTFDFQRAVKVSHERLKSVTTNFSNHTHDMVMNDQDNSANKETLDEPMKDVMNGMLREVSEHADQLEQDMQQNNIIFSLDDARIETVLKLGQEQDEHRVTLLDQDNNEYVMMRPSDSTVIIDDPQLIHDFILIIVISFVLGWMFTWMWRLAVGGATTILLVTVLFFIFMGFVFGADLKEAVFVGACVSLSSTAIVVKCVSPDQLEHLYGLLVMQDVILGFMLAIIPVLSKSGIQIFFAVIRITFSFIVFGLICFGILRLMPMVPRVIKSKNHELMLLGTLASCMTMLIISEYLGLGMELGCFAAGVLIRSRKGMFETSLKLIEPVRDMFACLFFACMGLHIYPSFLASEAMLLFTLAGAVIGFKYIATCIILYFFKFDIQKSSTMAIALAQISEFGFILASRAKQLSIISREVYYLLLAITSITLIATPVLLKVTHRTNQAIPHHSDEAHPTISVGMTDAEKLA